MIDEKNSELSITNIRLVAFEIKHFTTFCYLFNPTGSSLKFTTLKLFFNIKPCFHLTLENLSIIRAQADTIKNNIFLSKLNFDNPNTLFNSGFVLYFVKRREK